MKSHSNWTFITSYLQGIKFKKGICAVLKKKFSMLKTRQNFDKFDRVLNEHWCIQCKEKTIVFRMHVYDRMAFMADMHNHAVFFFFTRNVMKYENFVYSMWSYWIMIWCLTYFFFKLFPFHKLVLPILFPSDSLLLLNVSSQQSCYVIVEFPNSACNITLSWILQNA